MKPFQEKIVEKLLFVSALFSGLLTGAIFFFLLLAGLPFFTGGRLLDFFTQPWNPFHDQFGIVAMIAGSVAVSLLSMLIAFPLSFGCAVLIHMERERPVSRLLYRLVVLMTGIPTVIYGFVGIFLLVPLVREIFDAGSGLCVLSAALMLSLVVAPTMILFFCDSFGRVPRSYGDAVLAAGGTPGQKFIYVTLPGSVSGLLAGTTLALGRALGDTLIALMIAGNAVQIPGSVFDSARTLTSHIALVFAADYGGMEFKALYACALVLYCCTTVLALFLRRGTGEGRRVFR